LSGTSNVLLSAIGIYTNQQLNYFVKRPANIATTGTLTPFCVYQSNNAKNGRWAGGSISEIPTALQATLGGDLLVSSGIAAVAGSNSQTPAGMVFNSSDIDAAIAKYETGTVVSGNTTTAILAVTASSSVNYYLNWQVVFTISGNSGGYTSYVTAYNNTTKQITFDSFGTSVPAGATYKLIAPVFSKQLYGNSGPYEPDTKYYPSFWSTGGGSFNFAAFIPRGTNSVVNITNALIGRSQYGLWYTYPDNYGNYWGGHDVYNSQKLRLYVDGWYPDTSLGPRNGSIWKDPANTNNLCLFWIYDTTDLALVVGGSKTFDQISPKSVFSFPLPFVGNSEPISAAFDNTNNRLYVYQFLTIGNNTSYPLIHVYSCNKYV
jgi:hypothetical protein